MRILLMILLALSVLTSAACSKKKNSGIVTPPATEDEYDDDDDVYDDDEVECDNTCYGDLEIDYPANGNYYVSKVAMSNTGRYRNFLKLAIGFQYWGNYSRGYSYGCDDGLIYWIFKSQYTNNHKCSKNGMAYFNAFLDDLATSPAVATVEYLGDGYAEGYILVDGKILSGGYIDYYLAIPFNADMFMDGNKLAIDAGPLDFISNSTSDLLRMNVRLDGNTFGTVIFK